MSRKKSDERKRCANYYPLGLSYNGYKRYEPDYDGTYENAAKKDLGFRQYDPAIGRFHVIDPLAELQLSESTYQYAGNNPVNNVDALGLIKWPKFLLKAGAALINTFTNKTATVRPKNGKLIVEVKGGSRSQKGKGGRNSRSKKQNDQQNSSGGNNNNNMADTSGDSSGNDSGSSSNDNNTTASNSQQDNNEGQNDPLESFGKREQVFEPTLRNRNNNTNVGPNRTPRFNPSPVDRKGVEQQTAPTSDNPTQLVRWHREATNATDREQLRQDLYSNLRPLEAIALESLTLLSRDNDPAAASLKNRIAVLGNEKSFEDDEGSSTQAVQEILDAIKTANENGETTLDLNTLKKKYRGGVHRKRRVKINGKDVDITIIFGFGDLIVDPSENSKGANNDGRTKYDFTKDDGQYGVRIVVDPENEEDLEVYLGISEDQEITELLNDILPSDISETDKQVYETLLTNAKGENGVTTDITTDDWESDQDGTNDNCFAASKKMVENAAGDDANGDPNYSPGGPTRVYQLAIEENDDTGALSYDQDQVEKGIRVLLDHMEDGHPVQVGVDYTSEKGINHDQSTDHFVVLSSLHFDDTKDQFYFKFYENGTSFGPESESNIGASDDNKIYIEKDANGNYKLKSTVGPPIDRDASQSDNRLYEVTQIRINNDIPTGDTPDTLDQTNFSTSCTDTRRCY